MVMMYLIMMVVLASPVVCHSSTSLNLSFDADHDVLAATLSSHSHNSSSYIPMCYGMNGSTQCSRWSYCDSKRGTCKCFRSSTDIFQCDRYGNRLAILSCYCLTLNTITNTTEVGLCVYNCYHRGKFKSDVTAAYSKLPSSPELLEDAMCGLYNRTGPLCGTCAHGAYMNTYSYDLSCRPCKSGVFNWVKYIVVAYVPLTFFYLIVLLFEINIPSSNLQGYVFFSQIISSPIILRAILTYVSNKNSSILILVQFFGTVYGIWNLDFFRLMDLDICFHISPLTVLSLDLFVALYPLLLILLTYLMIRMHDSRKKLVLVLLKPFKTASSLFRRSWDVRTSTIDAFATFLFLSNVKFLNVCFDLLYPVQVCDTATNTSCKLALFYDATMPYFGLRHLPYAIIMTLVLLVFVVAPVLILTLYPFALCQKSLTWLPQRWRITLHVFVDSTQGCYKDGTEPGTIDCRWFSAIPFILRLAIFTTYTTILFSTFAIISAILLVVTALITVIVDPFKVQFQESSQYLVIFILFLASSFPISIVLDDTVTDEILFYVAAISMLLFQFLHIAAIIFHWARRRKVNATTCIISITK